MEFLLTLQVVIAYIGSTCQSPGPEQIIVIIGLIFSIIGFSIFSGGIIIYPLTMFLIELVVSGASVESIAAAVVSHFGTSGLSIEVISKMVDAIRSVLGC
ncbi:hypothetical protein LC593_26690 [Nostoc sp. CHAB 5844]|nr:hypothetical protein [Nostoc sp. CHAB 5844]